MGSCIRKKVAKKKQWKHDSTKPAEDSKASLTPLSISQPAEEEKHVVDDVEAIKEILIDASIVKKPANDDIEIIEKPSIVDPLKDVAAAKKKPEHSNSLKKKGSFKKEEAPQPLDGLARMSNTILIQCGRLNRSSSSKESNDNSNNATCQYLGSKR